MRLLVFSFLSAFAASATAQMRLPHAPPESVPLASDVKVKELEDATIDEKLEERAALDVRLNDENGKPVTLKELTEDGLPTIITFNYSNCPVLCSVQLGGLVDVLTKMDWTPGKQFRIVTVGLDHTQTVARTQETKKLFLERLEDRNVHAGWRFATGEKESIQTLADSLGYGFRYDSKRNEYLHPAALMFLSPSGVITHYMYGVKYEPAMVQAALTNAVLGQPHEATEKFILACFHYEPSQGNGKIVRNIMRYGGMAFVVCMAGVFAWGRRRLKGTELHP